MRSFPRPWPIALLHVSICFVGCAETKSAAESGIEGADDAATGTHGDDHENTDPMHMAGGENESGGAHAPAMPGGGGTQSTSKLAGTFTLQFVAAQDPMGPTPARAAQSSFIGSATDGPMPVPMTWVTAQESNGCVLLTPQPKLCDPGCGVSAVCVNDNECVAHPPTQPLGTIHLSGAGASEVSMTPIANKYQPKAGTMLPFPPCKEGDEIQLRVEGGAYQPFTLGATCISALEFDGPVKITRGQPMKLSWNMPGKRDLARVQVHVDISHHGGTKGKIDCDLEDTGSFEIPAAMVDKLVDLGVSGFPTIVVTRESMGGVKTGGPNQVKLVVQASIEREIQIDGLVSCTGDSDCPAPKTCQVDLQCK